MTEFIKKYYFEFPNEYRILIEATDKKSAEILNKFSGTFKKGHHTRDQAKIAGRIRIVSDEGKIKIGYLNKSSCFESTFCLEPENLLRFPLRDSGDFNTAKRKEEYMSTIEWKWRQLSILTSLVSGYYLRSGGYLIHAGFAELRGNGILLAGSSGSGKTTMSKTFKSPWISHSDDLSVVIPNRNYGFDAVPMPTWSSIFGKKDSIKKRRWDSTNKVRLKTILFFDHGPGVQLENTGPARTLCLLTELAKQSNELLINRMEKSAIVDFNRNYFENIYETVKKIPAYTLKFSLDSDYLKVIEAIDELN